MYQTPNVPNVLQEAQVSRTEPVVHVEMVITRVPRIKMSCPLVTKEAYDPGSNNLRQTSVIVSNLIAGGNYVFRVYISVKDAVPEGEWRYIETNRVQVTPVIATTVAGVFLSIIIVLFVKYKRLKRALRLLTHVDIPLEAVNTPQESLPLDQDGPGYETVSTVVREFHDDVDTNAKNSEDTSADAHERRESNEDIKMGRNLPDYEELDQSKREADDYTLFTKSGQKPELA
ncbi:Hypothetical predicted protein [Paramuricea clavata]|uniref:Uncharacterized protein n=1 Tax=Paramuricea clavata TaxID=317549 RepID=A0A6S7KDG9_PARCT|nr:Hypothetical predicted protein [Paramuricea clavata]